MTYPLAHAEQFFSASYLAAHNAHVGPVHEYAHVQLHPPPRSPLTAVAWSLQSSASVHSGWQFGYPP